MMTVKELKKALENYDDDTIVVVAIDKVGQKYRWEVATEVYENIYEEDGYEVNAVYIEAQ